MRSILFPLRSKAGLAALALLTSLLVSTPNISEAATATKTVSGTPFYIRFIGVPTNLRQAVNSAAFLWGQNFFSKVPVTINVTMKQTSGDVIATGTPSQFFHNFPGAPATDIDYSAALANAITGKDLTRGGSEITVGINIQNLKLLYTGTDGRCPSNMYDFESVMIHEIAHGLGFISNVSDFNGYGTYAGLPTAFDAFLQSSNGQELIDLNDGDELGNALTSSVTWNGPIGRIANGGINPTLYTPNPFQQDSSISHIDPSIPTLTHANQLMKPNYSMGDVYRSPGTLLKGMLQDMRNKPPLGKPTSAPSAPNKVVALVSDRSAILTFTPPNDYRGSHITGYQITGVGTSFSAVAPSSPFVVAGLENGKSYSFSIKAINVIGTSPAVNTNSVTPQAAWKPHTIDTKVATTKIAAATIKGIPTIAYSDSRTGQLRIAQNFGGNNTGGVWKVTKVDGSGGIGPNKGLKIGGPVSICSPTDSKSSAPELNLFYLDTEKKYLHYAAFNGKSWSFSIVDGDGSGNNTDTSATRGRTGSDISTSNACVVNGNKVEVFYRDENLGLLLGASLVSNAWRYEVIDGDRETDGRTKGDVGSMLSAEVLGKYTYLLYSSVNAINPPDQITQEDARLAVRNESAPTKWFYEALSQDSTYPVQGISLALTNSGGKIYADWLASSATSLPQADTIFSADVTKQTSTHAPDLTQSIYNLTKNQNSFITYGVPDHPLLRLGGNIYYSCANRVCEISSASDSSKQKISLVTSSNMSNGNTFVVITVKNKEFVIANINGYLQGFYN